ncbi:MAG: succinate dehydrogenase [Myxococcales bacterium]|nr:succinate dehydrogenase [Myxococcales bacterium]
MATTAVPTDRLRFGRPAGFAQTARRDAWWIEPVLTLVGLGSFVVYATWAALQGKFYYIGNLLSPFYSPEIWGPSPHAMFGPQPAWLPWPSFLPFSAAILVLAIPGNFRLTCYYYRGAYYKAFWADPPACGVGEPARGSYLGERTLPLVMQNVHRYFLYGAILVWFFLVHDVWKAVWFLQADGTEALGLSVGGVVLAVNVVLLWFYCTGCHSLRHLIGGRLKVFSKHPMQHMAWKVVTWLNCRHKLFAWCSLFSVGFSDIYVRLCAMGVWHDLRLFMI